MGSESSMSCSRKTRDKTNGKLRWRKKRGTKKRQISKKREKSANKEIKYREESRTRREQWKRGL